MSTVFQVKDPDSPAPGEPASGGADAAWHLPCAPPNIIDSLEDIVWSVSAIDGRTLYQNPASEKIFGVPVDAFMEDPSLWERLVHVDDRGIAAEFHRLLLSEGRAEMQYRLVRPDGQVRWVRDRAVLIRDAKGNPLRFDGLAVDITAQKLAEEALREKERSFRRLFMDHPHPMYVYDVSTLRFIDVNEAAVAIYGYSRDEWLSMDVTQIRPQQDVEYLFSKLKGRPFGAGENLETRHRYKSGKIVDVQVSLNYVEHRGRLAVLVMAQDISERKSAERALRESERRFRDFAENIRDVFWIAPASGQGALYVSPTFEEIWGRPTSDIIDNPGTWLQTVHPEDRSRVEERSGTISPEPDRLEYRIVRPDGGIRWISDRAFPIFDEKGELIKQVGIAEDITERKEAEKIQQAIFKVAELATSSEDTGDFYERVHEILAGLMPAKNFYIAVVDEKSGALTFPYWRDLHDPAPEPGPPGEGLTAWVLRTGKPLLLCSINRDNVGEMGIQPSGKSAVDWLGVPLKSGEKTFGVMAVQTYTPDVRYTEKQRDLLLFFSAQVSAVLRHLHDEEAVRESEERYSLAVQGSNDGIWDWDLRTGECYISPRLEQILGYEPGTLRPSTDSWKRRIHPEDKEQVLKDLEAHLSRQTSQFLTEYRILHRDGSYRWVLERGIARFDESGAPSRIAGSITDITDKKIAEEQLLFDALYDQLTGLPNRALLMDRLSNALARSRRQENDRFAVLFLDLDNFKNINDTLGHLAGDKLLIEFAKRLRSCIRPADTLARLGGDEFTILLENVHDADIAFRVADRIHTELGRPFLLAGNEIFITSSIGIAMSNDEYTRPEELLRDADLALYRAKDLGRARHELFGKDMHAKAVSNLQLETDLRRAVERKEFELHYQPLVDLRDNSLVGFEALVRWRHPDRGLLFPMDFIPLAEETGQIVRIDRLVLEETCRQSRRWNEGRDGRVPIKVSINLSARDISHCDLYGVLHRAIKAANANPGLICVEITETAIIQNTEAASRIFNQISELGVCLLLDDFGTGYSSLSHLHRFPISGFKIDRSFIERMFDTPKNLEMVRSLVTLAKSLHLMTIAEGVERREQHALLKQIGCDFAQGFLYSPPLTFEAADEMAAKAKVIL